MYAGMKCFSPCVHETKTKPMCLDYLLLNFLRQHFGRGLMCNFETGPQNWAQPYFQLKMVYTFVFFLLFFPTGVNVGLRLCQCFFPASKPSSAVKVRALGELEVKGFSVLGGKETEIVVLSSFAIETYLPLMFTKKSVHHFSCTLHFPFCSTTTARGNSAACTTPWQRTSRATPGEELSAKAWLIRSGFVRSNISVVISD